MNNLDETNSLIKTLSEAIQSDPDNFEIYLYRGNAYFNRGVLLDNAENYSLAIEDITKAIELDPDILGIYYLLGYAYLNRGNLLGTEEDYSLAIEDLTKAIEVFTKAIVQNPNDWEIYHLQGNAYFNRGNVSHSTEDYSLAIKDFTKAIELNQDNWEIYYLRGRAYYNRGGFLNIINDIDLAIEDYTKAIGLNLDNWEIYYNRSMASEVFQKHSECIEDINASLYWASKYKVKLVPALETIEHFYSTEPFNHWSWLICLVETNQFSTGLLSKYIDLQAQLYDFLLVFKYLEYGQIKLFSPKSDFLRIIPILIYHLKGCVTTYRLFDEKLDDEDTYQLTAQEYYYYIRSAFHFCKECKREMGVDSIIDDAISKLSARTGLNEEDYYYLGLIYYILILEFGVEGSDKKALEEEALSCFNRSKGFIWSRAMVELIEHDTYSDEIKGYIQEHCNLQREIDIKPLLSGNASEFLHQFDDYLHFQEITDIWPYLVSSVKYNEPIWEVFTLNEYDTETLKNKLQKKSVNDIFQKVVEEKKKEGVQDLSQEETEEIENDNTLSIFKSLSDKKKLISLFLEVTISSDRKNKDALSEKLRRYIYRDGKITIDEYLLLGYYYDTFKGDMMETSLLGDTASMVSEIIKAALIVPVVLGALASIFTAHLAERNGLDIKSSLKNRYASYDNFVEFTKNISQYKQFVGDTNAYEVILL